MNAERQVVKLEGLLARIQRNAARPRPAAAAVVVAPEPESPEAPAPAPAEPAVVAPAAPLAPVVAVAPAPAAASTSVDEFDDLEDAEDLELVEDEIIDITDLDADAAAEMGAEAEPAEAPTSSPRPKMVAESMDEALASATEHAGREVPLKTPPPESGDQVAVPLARPLPRQPLPSDDLLEVGDELPQRDFGDGPTPEQLGETIELDEPLGPALELDTAKAQPPRVEEPSPLEQPIGSAAVGTFDDDLELPPEAAADLAQHRAREAAAAAATAAAGDVRAQVVERPALADVSPTFAAAAESSRPMTFSELLDESLSL